MSNSYFDEDLVFIKDNSKTKEEVITKLANNLYKNGIVKETFLEKILEREKDYPTGLDLSGINVAIPHSDHEYVNEGRVSIAILENPVKFHKMDEPEEEIDVSIVIMLSIAEPKAHMDLLQKLFAFIQEQEVLEKIVKMDSREEVIQSVKEYIN